MSHLLLVIIQNSSSLYFLSSSASSSSQLFSLFASTPSSASPPLLRYHSKSFHPKPTPAISFRLQSILIPLSTPLASNIEFTVLPETKLHQSKNSFQSKLHSVIQLLSHIRSCAAPTSSSPKLHQMAKPPSPKRP